MARQAGSAGIGLSLTHLVRSGRNGVFSLARLRAFQPQSDIGEFKKTGSTVGIADLLVVPGAVSGRAPHGGSGVDPHFFCSGYGALQQIFAFLTRRLFGHRQVVEVYPECLDFPRIFVVTSRSSYTPLMLCPSLKALITGTKSKARTAQDCEKLSKNCNQSQGLTSGTVAERLSRRRNRCQGI